MRKKWPRWGVVCAIAAAVLLSACVTQRSGDSGGESAETRARLHLQLAVGYFSRGQLDTAELEIKRALQFDSGSADAHNVQGLIQMAQGQARQADASFQRALRIAPDNAEVLNNYGWFLCQNNREKESFSYFEKAIKNSGQQSPARALNNAGMCSLRIKDLASAERYFTKAFENDPGNLSINANLADVNYRRGRLQQAQFYLSRALKMADSPTAELLWLAVRIERKQGDEVVANSHATQLRRRYPNSPEFAAYLRGAFDE